MEKVAGWTVKIKEDKRPKDLDSWVSRKAAVDLQRNLMRVNTEEKMKVKQIDAALSRFRISFEKKRGIKKDYTLENNNRPVVEGLDEVEKGNSNTTWLSGSETTQGSLDESASDSLLSMKSQDQSAASTKSLSSQSSSLSKDEISNQESKVLSQLLITNGEIDLNKILALHLVAISPPSVSSQGASQALLTPVTRYANILPSYLLSPKIICRCKGKCKCNDIRPSEMTVSVNTQVEMIIMTAVQVLARLSRAKLHILIALAHNPTFLNTLMSDEDTKRHTVTIQESGIMNSSNYSKNYTCTVVKADSNSMTQFKEKKRIIFKMLLPHHYPVFQTPVFGLRSSSGGLMGDRDESVPVMLNLYKHVTLGKPIEDEDSGLSVLPDFCNTRLAIISDDGSDFALISKSGNIVKPTSLSLAENLAALVRSTSKVDEIKKEAEDPVLPVNYNPRPKFSKNPAVMMESLIGLAKENLGLSVKPPRAQLGISEVQRRRMESEQLRCSILRRLSNMERMAMAREAAKTTFSQKEMLRKSEKSRLENFSSLMASVMPKRSIMSLARNCSRKERDFMFKPLIKGGLGFGDLILKDNVLAQIEAQESKKDTNKGSGRLPSILSTSKSQTLFMESDRVRNEIVGAELKEKVRHFVGSDSVLRRYNDSNNTPPIRADRSLQHSVQTSSNSSAIY